MVINWSQNTLISAYFQGLSASFIPQENKSGSRDIQPQNQHPLTAIYKKLYKREMYENSYLLVGSI